MFCLFASFSCAAVHVGLPRVPPTSAPAGRGYKAISPVPITAFLGGGRSPCQAATFGRLQHYERGSACVRGKERSCWRCCAGVGRGWGRGGGGEAELGGRAKCGCVHGELFFFLPGGGSYFLGEFLVFLCVFFSVCFFVRFVYRYFIIRSPLFLA